MNTATSSATQLGLAHSRITNPYTHHNHHYGTVTRLNDDLIGETLRSMGIAHIADATSYFYSLANHDTMIDGRGELVFTTATHSLNVAIMVDACLSRLSRFIDLGDLDSADRRAVVELRERRNDVSAGAFQHDELKQGIERHVLQKPDDFDESERRRVIMHAEGAPFIEKTGLPPAEIIRALIYAPHSLPKIERFRLKSAMQAAHHAFFGQETAFMPLFGRVTEFSVPGLPPEKYKWKSYPLHIVEFDRASLIINGNYVPLTHTQLVASLILHVIDGGEAQWSLERPYKKDPVPAELITMRLRAVNKAGLYTRNASQQRLIEACIKVLEQEIHHNELMLTSGDILHGRGRNASV